jgi:hypothetical protein
MKNFFGLANKKNLFVFIIGLLTYIQVRVLGTFGIAELIALSAFPFIKPFKQFKDPRVKRLGSYLLLGVFGLIISNIYNDVSLEKSLKGTFFLLMLYIDIPFVYWMLKDNYRRILFYLAGYALSNIFAFLFFPTSALSSMINLADGEASNLMSIWLVYFIQPSAVFFGGILYYKNKRILAIIVIQLFAFYALFNSSRNIFLIWTIVAFIIIILGKITKQNTFVKKIKIRKATPIIIVLFIICLFSIKGVYESLASDGSLGETAKNKYFKQKYESGNIGLLASRLEFFIALKAISERPVFGYGSYPNDETNLKIRTYQDFGVNLRDIVINPDEKRLSGHSHILNSYLYGGFLGVFFWIYAMYIVILFLRKHLFYDPRMIGLFLIMTLSWIWDYFLSPFAFRLQESIFLITIILIIKSSEKSKKNVKRNTISRH